MGVRISLQLGIKRIQGQSESRNPLENLWLFKTHVPFLFASTSPSYLLPFHQTNHVAFKEPISKSGTMAMVWSLEACDVAELENIHIQP